MWLSLLLLPLAFAFNEYAQCRLGTVDVRHYGAVGDGVTLNTAAFKRAIQYTNENGGGCIGVYNGQYLVAQVDLLSNTFLYIREDATVLGSVEQKDYSWDNKYGWDVNWVVVRALNVTNVGILGKGTLSGQAMKMIDHYDPVKNQLIPKRWLGPPHNCVGECRPRNLVFVNTTTIYLNGVTIKDSPDWTSHYLGCRDILIDDVTVYGNERWPNNDGIDPDSSQDIVIRNSHISTGDDGICPKTTPGYGPLRNMTVYNTTIRSRSSAIKFGSATPEDLYDVVFENITIGVSHRALGIQVRDAGSVYNVTFRNIKIDWTQMYPEAWWGAGEFVWITANQRSVGRTCGTVHHILFENITALSENGALISSFHGNQPFVHDITFRNVHVTLAKLGNYTQPTRDYRPSYQPDTLPGPIDGFFFEYCERIFLSDCSVTHYRNRTNFGKCYGYGKEAKNIVNASISCFQQ